jgi:uncharacterized protein YwgA
MLAIGCAKNRGLSPVQLQKVLFLLGKELPSEVGSDFYDFSPYNYGPFDRAVYTDASMLSLTGCVAVTKSPGGYNEYSATPDGLQMVCKLKTELPPRAVAYVESVVDWAQSLSFSELVRAIYSKYPEYRENSVFQG